jgi:hypothetical protein
VASRLVFQSWERALASIWRNMTRDAAPDSAYCCQTLLLSALERRAHLYLPRLMAAPTAASRRAASLAENPHATTLATMCTSDGAVDGDADDDAVDESYVDSIVFLNALAECYFDCSMLARVAGRETVASRHARRAAFLYLWLFGATAHQTAVRFRLPLSARHCALFVPPASQPARLPRRAVSPHEGLLSLAVGPLRPEGCFAASLLR